MTTETLARAKSISSDIFHIKDEIKQLERLEYEDRISFSRDIFNEKAEVKHCDRWLMQSIKALVISNLKTKLDRLEKELAAL